MDKSQIKPSPTLQEQEQKLRAKYGSLGGKGINRLTQQSRKYFDSGDYAMSKAGKNTNDLNVGVGEKHPSPESIPHQQLTAAVPQPPAPPPLSGSSSAGSITSPGLPIIGAAGTMTNPSGLSPPAAHHISAMRDDAQHSPNVAPSELLPHSAISPHAGLAETTTGAPIPPGGGVRPAFVRRASQVPPGMQYRVKN
ncbi:hypothetical protein GGI21_000120 [Coemansia aciculifera]|nr:hypothetical protein GGI21_000120 [Coemansia aciculifera]